MSLTLFDRDHATGLFLYAVLNNELCCQQQQGCFFMLHLTMSFVVNSNGVHPVISESTRPGARGDAAGASAPGGEPAHQRHPQVSVLGPGHK